jgi:hypothetical protein
MRQLRMLNLYCYALFYRIDSYTEVLKGVKTIMDMKKVILRLFDINIEYYY